MAGTPRVAATPPAARPGKGRKGWSGEVAELAERHGGPSVFGCRSPERPASTDRSAVWNRSQDLSRAWIAVLWKPFWNRSQAWSGPTPPLVLLSYAIAEFDGPRPNKVVHAVSLGRRRCRPRSPGSHFVPKRAAAGSPYRLRRRFLRGTTAAVPVTITRVTGRRRGGNGAARVGVQDRPGGAGGRGRDLAGPGACGGAGTEGRPRSGRRGPGRRCQPVRLLADVRGGRAAARPGAERPSRAGAGRHQDLDAVG